MNVESVPKMFEIHVEELHSWEKRPHKHSFFEIVYVAKGSGSQCINEHVFEYEAGNIFLLPPLDCHSFQIKEPTTFYFVRFTDYYFIRESNITNYNTWFDKIAYIIANYNKIPGDIIPSDREREFIIQNIKNIYEESLVEDSYSQSIILGSIATILNILARSIEQNYVEQANEIDNRFGEILRYINTHIFDSDNVRIPVLADKFSISKSYFSEYFKKHAGVSLADYIIKSKLRIVEAKILHTDLSLKEIAFQLNFTDSSHLSRSFKKAYGITVKEFRGGAQICGA